MVTKRQFEYLEARVSALEGKRANTLTINDPDRTSVATSILVMAYMVLSYARDTYEQCGDIDKADLEELRRQLDCIIEQFKASCR